MALTHFNTFQLTKFEPLGIADVTFACSKTPGKFSQERWSHGSLWRRPAGELGVTWWRATLFFFAFEASHEKLKYQIYSNLRCKVMKSYIHHYTSIYCISIWKYHLRIHCLGFQWLVLFPSPDWNATQDHPLRLLATRPSKALTERNRFWVFWFQRTTTKYN